MDAEHTVFGREKGEEPPQLMLRFQPAAPPAREPLPPPVFSVVRCGQVITQSTLVANDLRECPGDGLVVGANRIVVDLGCHTIDGVGLGTGLRNDGFNAVTVTNGTIQEFHNGVQLQFGANDNVVRSLTVQLNQLVGI